MYIINGKSDTGPNPGYLYGNTPSLTTITYRAATPPPRRSGRARTNTSSSSSARRWSAAGAGPPATCRR